MAFGAKYFMLNRSEDWENSGFLDNFHFEQDAMISSFEHNEGSFYFSQAFDSNQEEMVWNRLKLKIHVPQNTIFKLRVYASDSLNIKVDLLKNDYPKGINIDEYLANPNISCVSKVQFLEYIGSHDYENIEDILLFNCKGRYLWICIEIKNYGRESAKIEEVKIEFPRISFVDYLPEVYRRRMPDDMFLARFIGIFQSIYLDFEDEVIDVPKHFDPKTGDIDVLNFVSDWISFKDASMWTDDKLRRVMQEIINLYKIKGTKTVISKIVNLFIDAKPIILEKFNIEDCENYLKNKKHLDILYGDNKCYFSVIISDDYIKNSESYVGTLKIINRFKPIDAICNLIVLNKEMHLDHHCYLGINSFITGNKEIVLTGGE